MAEKVKVAALANLAPGSCTTVDCNGRPVALFNVGGEVYALDNVCMHRGGPLGEGSLDGEVVTCPWHGWRWNVKTGALTVDPTRKTSTFKVTVEGQDVYVEA